MTSSKMGPRIKNGSACYSSPLLTQLGVLGECGVFNKTLPTPFSPQNTKLFLLPPGPKSLPPIEEIKRTQIPELPLLSPSPGCNTSARRTGRSLRQTVRPCFLLCLGGRASFFAWVAALQSEPGAAHLPEQHLPPPRQTHLNLTRLLRASSWSRSPPSRADSARRDARVGVLRGDHGCRLLPPVPTVTIESHGCPGDAGAGRALLMAPRQLLSG